MRLWGSAEPGVMSLMSIEIVEIDLSDVSLADYIKSIYRRSSEFLSNTYLALVDLGGLMLSKDQIEIIDKSQTQEHLITYEVHGANSEILIGSDEGPDVENWYLPDNLPCHLDNRTTELILDLMSRNKWNYYFGLGQTQMVISSDNRAFINCIKLNYIS